MISAIKKSAVRSVDAKEIVGCPLCGERMRLWGLQRHLGHHQEQLALFALPPNIDATEDNQEEEELAVRVESLAEDDSSGESPERDPNGDGSPDNMPAESEMAQKAVPARQAAVEAFSNEQAEKEKRAQAERERIIAEYERNKALGAELAKLQREELIMQLRIKEEKRKREEEEDYQRFLQKQKQKEEEEEKAKKAKQEQELEDAMRRRLAQFGFQENQIQAMIKPEEQARLQQLQLGATPLNPLPHITHQPTYAKVHKEYLAIETLHYYNIPYEIDRVSNLTKSLTSVAYNMY